MNIVHGSYVQYLKFQLRGKKLQVENVSLLITRRYLELRTITEAFKVSGCLGQCQMLNWIVRTESCNADTTVNEFLGSNKLALEV